MRAKRQLRGGPRRWTLSGTVAIAGFTSGDVFVVRHWTDAPIGPFTDVMWATSKGEKVLLVPDAAVAEVVTSVYPFDRVEEVPIRASAGDRWLEVVAGAVEMQLKAGSGWRLPSRRPLALIRWVEAPLARMALGVRPVGESATNVRVTYRFETYRTVQEGWATVSDTDLGRITDVDTPVRFGVSQPPRRPAIIATTLALADPSGRLDDVVRHAARRRVGS